MRGRGRFLGAGLLLAGVALAGPDRRDPPTTTASILRRWEEASPDERRHLGVALERAVRARRFHEARNLQLDFEGRRWSVAHLFLDLLEPALATPVEPERDTDIGFVEIHRRALAALETLREGYAAPRPVRTGTLDLFLDYAYRSLASEDLPPLARLRFFVETLRNVRDLSGRVAPGPRTHWIVRQRLLPAVLGLGKRLAGDPDAAEPLAEAASLLYQPAILGPRDLVRLAPLTKGKHSRGLLLRAYRQGTLDTFGVRAMGESVALQVRDDAAFAAGSPPLLLELICDERVGPRARGRLLDVVFDQLEPVQALRAAVLDLLAAGYGGPPRDLAAYRELRRESKGILSRPQSRRRARFLQVVLVQRHPDVPPVLEEVVRADRELHAPLHIDDVRVGRRFVGVLVPAPGGDDADFLGPPAGLADARDHRLLRRTLHGERIAITTFGARDEVIELCVALPDDSSEPVPVRGAGLPHVLRLVRDRLVRTGDADERRDLVRFLARIGTAEASRLAVEHAARGASVAELLPLVESGDREAAAILVGRLSGLSLAQRERALASILRVADDALREAVRALCDDADVGIAALAADALLSHGDPAGARRLLRHPSPYARAVGASLALRLAPISGNLRVLPQEPVDIGKWAALAPEAFPAQGAGAWARFGRWFELALRDPARVRESRRRHRPLRIGKRQLSDSDYVTAWLEWIAAGEHREHWSGLAAHVLSTFDPGRGIREPFLGRLLDALEQQARDDPALRSVYRDALVLLACAQYGMEADAEFLRLANERLARLAGRAAPEGAARKAGVWWPIWAASEASG